MTDLAVIMSVYINDKISYLEQSVQSILTQTYADFDFFIAFDGPVSNEIENYLINLRDKRIHLYKIEKNGGLARALNFLLEIVLNNPEYKFIARMDADDISVSNRFESQKKFFLSNPKIACVGSWYKEIDENDKIVSYQKLPLKHEEIKKFILRRSPLAHSSVMFRREMVDRAGLYPTDSLDLKIIFFGVTLLRVV
ncbi:MAG: glycosyltransferase [Bacteroidales bacterium]|nr:glycosyltransferase [Bacteroidales bacterium]